MRKKAKSRSPARLTASRDGCCSTPSISAGRYAAGDNVLFIMTVGSPGLYAYARDFLGADHKDST